MQIAQVDKMFMRRLLYEESSFHIRVILQASRTAHF